MLSSSIREKLAARATELDEIQNRIAALNSEKREAAVAVQAALKGRNAEELVSARADLARVNEEIEALKLIEVEIAKSHPVGHDLFWAEYAEFFAQQQGGLDETYSKITAGLAELETAYHNYDGVYQRYLAQLRAWQDLAGKIGLAPPAELQNKTNSAGHRSAKNALTMLRPTGGF